MRTIILVVLSLLLGACAAASTASPTSAYERFKQHLDERRFLQAYLLMDDVERELRDVGEGAAGFEYQRLVGMTAGNGQAAWSSILESPDVPLDRKIDLVQEIHRNVVDEAPSQ